MKPFTAFVALCLLSACGAVDNTDTQATLEAQNDDYATAIAALPLDAERMTTQTWATVEAAETEAARVSSINAQLLATIAAVSSPTPPLIQDTTGSFSPQSPGTPQPNTSTAAGAFRVSGVGTGIRQSDGCLIDIRSEFPTTLDELYTGLQAFDVDAGVPIRAEWYQAGTLVYQFDWTVDQTYTELCIWFSITQEDVAFTPGNWSVRLYANNAQIGSTVGFSFIGDSMQDG